MMKNRKLNKREGGLFIRVLRLHGMQSSTVPLWIQSFTKPFGNRLNFLTLKYWKSNILDMKTTPGFYHASDVKTKQEIFPCFPIVIAILGCNNYFVHGWGMKFPIRQSMYLVNFTQPATRYQNNVVWTLKWRQNNIDTTLFFNVLTLFQRPYNVVLTSCAGWVVVGWVEWDKQMLQSRQKLLKVTSEEWVFIKLALNIQCHIVKNTLLHTAFSAILPAG